MKYMVIGMVLEFLAKRKELVPISLLRPLQYSTALVADSIMPRLVPAENINKKR